MTRLVVLDTETTGISHENGHRIIEIGCLEIIDRQLTKRTFHQYINPERSVDPGAFKVHGLGNEFLSDKPKFGDIVNEFVAFIEGAELIIHNAPFDVGFMDAEFRRIIPAIGKTHSFCKITDTLQLARRKHPGQKNSLDALCKRYAIDNSNRDFHGALLDAELLAKVYLVMTGGQGSLLGNLEQQQYTDDPKKNRANNFSHLKMKKIIASKAEEAAHIAYLKALATTADSVVWQEQELTND